ncbi:MAG: helix-turn-helix domain-containing protein [Sphingobacteriales bacterium]|nr:helix-turn-helix domain-containing protein [Sphingobacteriales bacterium]
MSIEVINISVDQLNALLDEKVEKIISAFILKNKEPPSDQWFDMNGLIEYLPSHPKSQTIYDWVHKKTMPFHKTPGSKTLVFLKSEIDEWMKSGRRKTQHEKSEIVKNYLNKKNK